MIAQYEQTIKQFQAQLDSGQSWIKEELQSLENSLKNLKDRAFSELSAWDRVMIARHPKRPRSSQFIDAICSEFEELSGDRLYSDDHAVIGGLATIDDQPFVVIAQEKGKDTESRVYRNFGMLHPEGFRKALRLMKMAEKFNLPVLSLIDTQGAFPGLGAEERGQAWAIAENLKAMATLKTPIIILIIGEGCSGGALGMGVGDVVGMLENAYYSVISPEGCASILWKDPTKNDKAADALKLTAEDMLDLSIIDEIIPEPVGGAHMATEQVFEASKSFILKRLKNLACLSAEELVEKRYLKFRNMGQYTTEK